MCSLIGQRSRAPGSYDRSGPGKFPRVRFSEHVCVGLLLLARYALLAACSGSDGDGHDDGKGSDPVLDITRCSLCVVVVTVMATTTANEVIMMTITAVKMTLPKYISFFPL